MIELKQLDFSYPNTKGKHCEKSGDSEIFSGVNMKLDQPGIYGLLGANGVGKTTLLNLMSGLLFPSSGKLLIDGTDILLLDEPTDGLDIPSKKILSHHFHPPGRRRGEIA